MQYGNRIHLRCTCEGFYMNQSVKSLFGIMLSQGDGGNTGTSHVKFCIFAGKFFMDIDPQGRWKFVQVIGEITLQFFQCSLIRAEQYTVGEFHPAMYFCTHLCKFFQSNDWNKIIIVKYSPTTPTRSGCAGLFFGMASKSAMAFL